MTTLILIAAIGPRGELGYSGRLPWHYPEDLKHFKETTFGHPIIMGRKTYHSLGRILPNRPHLVLSRGAPDISKDNVYWFNSVEDILSWCRDTQCEKAFVIGGSEVFRLFESQCDYAYITHIHRAVVADIYFPMELLQKREIVEQTQMGPELTLIKYGHNQDVTAI